MAVDLSRVRFDALRDHAGVLLQQGRVLLDADFNELVAILERRLRTDAADLGSQGPTPGIAGVAVVPRTTPDAFLIQATGGALTIGRGRMYVDGLLAENHGTGVPEFDALLSETRRSQDTPYTDQPYWKPPAALPTSGTHLVYLDVWQREVTGLEAPDLVEQAVGVDTTARLQTVWQVRVHPPDTPGIGCSTPDAAIPGWADVIAPSAGRLTTGTAAVADTDDPCELPPSGGYRGRENQTYRVEIHDGGPAGVATFKWSRDNGSVASAVVEVLSSTRLRPASLGRDSELRFKTGDWVEILDDRREFDQKAGELRKIDVHVEDGTITFAPALPADLQMTTAQAAARHLRVRRWDQKGQVRSDTGTALDDLDAAGATGAIKVPSGTTRVVLEHGVTVRLRAPGGRFRTADHWVFAARTNDTSVEQLTDAPPRGIHHHYARLAVVTFPGTESDCRAHWPPVSTGETCGECTVCVTPESHAGGTLTIQDGVELVKPTGGTVCLSAGVYHLDEGSVTIEGTTSVTIHGQGVRTVLVARSTAVEVRTSAFVTLEDFAVLSASGLAAVRMRATAAVTAQRLVVLAVAATDADVPRAGFELSGVSLLTRLRDNVVLAPVGVGSGAGEAEDATLLTAGLEIAGNVLVSPVAGVALEGRAAHLLDNAVRDNTVLGSRQAGVRAPGLLGPGGSFDVSGNQVGVPGTGVEVATGGFSVCDNDVVGTLASVELGGDGIAVVPGSLGSVRGATRVSGNRVRDVGGTGIVVRAPAGDVEVTHNVVERSAAGIVFEERGRARSASVSGNVVRRAGGRESDDKGAGAVGIQVVGAHRASVEGNTVVEVGTTPATGVGAAGVRVLATRESSVSNNSVETVGAPEEGSPGTGIHVAGTFERTLVTGNFSRRAPDDVDGLPPVAFVGLQIGAGASQEGPPTARFGEYVFVPGAAGGFLVGAKTAYAAAQRAATAVVEANTVTGGGETPAALIVVGGEVVASANQCHQPRESAAASIDLTAEAATVNANRARGGRPSIALQVDPKRLAVVGNLTSNGITVFNNPLGAPWAPLNPDGF